MLAISCEYQGSAADVATMAMVAIADCQQLHDMGWKLIMQVLHDMGWNMQAEIKSMQGAHASCAVLSRKLIMQV